jgi:hypothetical protein
MITKNNETSFDATRVRVSEPTKYIIHCCELRKRREAKAVAVAVTMRSHGGAGR